MAQAITVRKVHNGKGRIVGYNADFNGAFESGTLPTPTAAKAETLAAMALQAEYLHAQRFFFCADKLTVYHLSYRDGWQVEIAGPDRKSTCAWLTGRTATYQEQCDRIRVHLQDAYGGILAEM